LRLTNEQQQASRSDEHLQRDTHLEATLAHGAEDGRYKKIKEEHTRYFVAKVVDNEASRAGLSRRASPITHNHRAPGRRVKIIYTVFFQHMCIPVHALGRHYSYYRAAAETGRNILVKQTGCCADWVVFKILA
jgi:hypothetical protein